MDALDWKIICVTYNVNSRKPESDQIYQLLQKDDVKDAVIVAIGLQVCVSLPPYMIK